MGISFKKKMKTSIILLIAITLSLLHNITSERCNHGANAMAADIDCQDWARDTKHKRNYRYYYCHKTFFTWYDGWGSCKKGKKAHYYENLVSQETQEEYENEYTFGNCAFAFT